MALPPARTVLYDGDFGIDDSMALLYLLAQPRVEVAAVGSVHGNATSTDARNALTVLDLAGRPGIPVAVGAARPLAQEVSISTVVHGEDGLGGQATTPSHAPLPDCSAAEQLVRTTRQHPGATIVATGPLTNVALAVLLDPGIVDRVGRLVVMGGTVEHPGNITPYAEANIHHDPEAADLVFAAGFALTIVGLDVTMPTWLDSHHLDRIAGADTPRARFVWAMLQHYLDFYAGRHARPGCPVHDPTAAAVALDPTLATYREAAVGVELRSPATRGMLLVDRREFASSEAPPGAPLVRLATGVDGPRLIEAFLGGLLTETA